MKSTSSSRNVMGKLYFTLSAMLAHSKKWKQGKDTRWPQHFAIRCTLLDAASNADSKNVFCFCQTLLGTKLRTIFSLSSEPTACAQSAPITRGQAQVGWKQRLAPISGGAVDGRAAEWIGVVYGSTPPPVVRHSRGSLRKKTATTLSQNSQCKIETKKGRRRK